MFNQFLLTMNSSFFYLNISKPTIFAMRVLLNIKCNLESVGNNMEVVKTIIYHTYVKILFKK